MLQFFLRSCERLWPYWFAIVSTTIVAILLMVVSTLFEPVNGVLRLVRFLSGTLAAWGLWLSIVVFVYGNAELNSPQPNNSGRLWGNDESARAIQRFLGTVSKPFGLVAVGLAIFTTLFVAFGAPFHAYEAAYGP